MWSSKTYVQHRRLVLWRIFQKRKKNDKSGAGRNLFFSGEVFWVIENFSTFYFKAVTRNDVINAKRRMAKI
jgi:hypothetical protein